MKTALSSLIKATLLTVKKTNKETQLKKYAPR